MGVVNHSYNFEAYTCVIVGAPLIFVKKFFERDAGPRVFLRGKAEVGEFYCCNFYK